jgi:hypothetical protein
MTAEGGAVALQALLYRRGPGCRRETMDLQQQVKVVGHQDLDAIAVKKPAFRLITWDALQWICLPRQVQPVR